MKRLTIIFFIIQYALLLTMYGIFAQPNQDSIDKLDVAIIKSSSTHSENEARKLEDLLVACEEDEDGDESFSARKHSFTIQYFFNIRYDLMLVYFYQHLLDSFSSLSFSIATFERHIVFETFRL